MARYLLVTNDFPPRIGGIESFNAWIAAQLAPNLVVLGRADSGAAAYDAQLGYPVYRKPGPLLPTPQLARSLRQIIAKHQTDTVIFGAAAPLAALAPSLRVGSVRRIVGITHGHEVTWSRVAPRRLRTWLNALDAVSYISDHTHNYLQPLVASQRLVRLAPPVDTSQFYPAPQPVAEPICVAAARFTRQKGLDTLLRAWRQVRTAVPEAQLRLIGAGAYEPRLRRIAKQLGLEHSVSWLGPKPQADVAAELRRAMVFALPMRNRWRGWYQEGLGLAGAEAAASGLPVIIGNSGGAPETVVAGESGFVVDDADQTAAAVIAVLRDPQLRWRMGRAGRLHVVQHYAANVQQSRLRQLLAEDCC